MTKWLVEDAAGIYESSKNQIAQYRDISYEALDFVKLQTHYKRMCSHFRALIELIDNIPEKPFYERIGQLFSGDDDAFGFDRQNLEHIFRDALIYSDIYIDYCKCLNKKYPAFSFLEIGSISKNLIIKLLTFLRNNEMHVGPCFKKLHASRDDQKLRVLIDVDYVLQIYKSNVVSRYCKISQYERDIAEYFSEQNSNGERVVQVVGFIEKAGKLLTDFHNNSIMIYKARALEIISDSDCFRNKTGERIDENERYRGPLEECINIPKFPYEDMMSILDGT